MKSYSLLLFTALIFLLGKPLHAQRTAAEWIEAAEAAEARGDYTDAGSCRSAAANLQSEAGAHEAAAENYRRAAGHFRKDGRLAQADAEHTNAATAYERAAETRSRGGRHQEAAELFEKAARQYEAAGRTAMSEAARLKAAEEREKAAYSAGGEEVQFSATGMNQTTGHVVTLHISNPTGRPYTFPAGHFYIPGINGHQSFAARVETPVAVPAGGSASLPVLGDCTDIFAPPPALGAPVAMVSDWYFVSETAPADPRHPFGTVSPIDGNWRPFPSRGWRAVRPHDGALTLTVPATAIPLNAYLDTGSSPAEEARYYVGMADQVRKEVQHLRESGQLPPVLSQNPDADAQGITQQVIWIAGAAAQGKTYSVQDFKDNLARQYEEQTGTPLAEENPVVQEELNDRAETAWENFLFVGSAAKVFSADTQPGPVFQDDGDALPDDCALVRAGLTVTVRIQGARRRDPAVDTTFRDTVRVAAGDEELDIFIGDNRLIRRGDTVTITITDPFIDCDCTDGDCTPRETVYLEGPRGGDDEVNHIGDDSREDDFNEANRDEDGAAFGGAEADGPYVTRFITNGRMGGYQGRTVYPGIKFRLRATCVSEDCGSAEVIQKFQIKIR